MSQIADFHLVPVTAVAEVKVAATPKKGGWFSKPKDVFYETLAARGRSLLNFEWSGYVFVVLLEYLEEKHGLDFKPFSKNELASSINAARHTDDFAFNADEARALLERMSPIMPAQEELEAYWNEFTEEFDEAGKAMSSALDSLKTCLAAVTPGHVGLLIIG